MKSSTSELGLREALDMFYSIYSSNHNNRWNIIINNFHHICIRHATIITANVKYLPNNSWDRDAETDAGMDAGTVVGMDVEMDVEMDAEMDADVASK